MATRFQVSIDCADPTRLVRFWCEALGYVPEPPPEGFDSWYDYLLSIGEPADEMKAELDANDGELCDSAIDPDGRGPRIWFQKVPEGKQLKNRVHLDLAIGGGYQAPLDERRQKVRAEADRLVRAGARVLREFSHDGLEHFGITLQDPEGNEFCVH
jgi:hypothetical protein